MSVMILSIGGFGATISQLVQKKVSNLNDTEIKFVFSDTDAKALDNIMTDEKCKIKLSKKSKVIPSNFFDGVKEIFIVAALGRSTGRKFFVSTVQSAVDAGIPKVNVVAIIPFFFEGEKKNLRAFNELDNIVHMGINHLELFNNEKFLENTAYEEDFMERMRTINELITDKIKDLVIKAVNIHHSVWGPWFVCAI